MGLIFGGQRSVGVVLLLFNNDIQDVSKRSFYAELPRHVVGIHECRVINADQPHGRDEEWV